MRTTEKPGERLSWIVVPVAEGSNPSTHPKFTTLLWRCGARSKALPAPSRGHWPASFEGGGVFVAPRVAGRKYPIHLVVVNDCVGAPSSRGGERTSAEFV